MDQFENQPETLQHLEKVQKARTFEFWKYSNYLNDKHGFNLSGWSTNSLSNMSPQSKTLLSWRSPGNINSLAPAFIQEKQKYRKLFNRMFDAKIAYQEAGGTYTEKRAND